MLVFQLWSDNTLPIPEELQDCIVSVKDAAMCAGHKYALFPFTSDGTMRDAVIQSENLRIEIAKSYDEVLYCDVYMQTGAATYDWKNIKTVSW